jgi:DNA-binding transcriptional LysR family regulator
VVIELDIAQAKTFIAVVETGSFVEAAKRVHVTQSTVSVRIKTLEEQLGKTLFERSKAGAKLTSVGVQFLKHAQGIVRMWEHARLEISLPDGFKQSLVVGGQYSLWDGFLVEWLASMRNNEPLVAIRGQFGTSNTLMAGLIDGTIDVGVMYTPQTRPGFKVSKLFEDQLVLVACDARGSLEPARNYVMIDWGPEFLADHALNYPEISVPGTYLELGAISLQYLLKTGASGYVPKRLVRDHILRGELFVIEDAPVFSYPAYAVYSDDLDKELLSVIVQELKSTVRSMELV